MRTRDMRRFAAGLAVLVPVAGAAFDWTAQLGLLYDRNDAWPDGGLHSFQPRLDIDLRLDAHGDIGGPGVVAWGGAAGYRRASTELNGARTNLANDFTYHAEAALFRHQYSPVSLTAFADRTDSRFESSLGQDVLGDRLTDRYGGTLRLVGASTPDLELGYSRLSFDEELNSFPSRSRTNDSLTARINHDVGAFGLGATYRGDWSDGTWVSDQFNSYQVDVVGRVGIGPRTGLDVSDRYYHRMATTTAAGAFGLDANSFQGSFRSGNTPGSMTVVRYANRRALTETATASDETTDNSLRGQRDFRLPAPEYFIRGLADLSMTEQRTSLGNLTSTGGTFGAELWWRRAITSDDKLAPGVRASSLFEISGGPLVGFLTVKGDSTVLGYGGTARARANLPWRGYQLGGTYEISYGSDLFGRRGWSLQQSGSGSVGGAAGVGRFNAQATLLARRGWNPVLGEEATRSVSLLANYAWRRYSALAQVQLSNGILPGTDSFVGDGILVPVGFDTWATTVVLGGSAVLFPNLLLRADARYTSSSFPGQPDITLAEGTSALAYRYGAFDVSIEDRLSRANPGTTPLTRNVVFVRLSRTIGSRF